MNYIILKLTFFDFFLVFRIIYQPAFIKFAFRDNEWPMLPKYYQYVVRSGCFPPYFTST